MREFFQRLSGRDRYMVGNLFFLFLIQGIFVLLIGSVLPMMKEEYGLSYQVGGLMISAHSIGNMAAGLLAGLIPMTASPLPYISPSTILAAMPFRSSTGWLG